MKVRWQSNNSVAKVLQGETSSILHEGHILGCQLTADWRILVFVLGEDGFIRTVDALTTLFEVIEPHD